MSQNCKLWLNRTQFLLNVSSGSQCHRRLGKIWSSPYRWVEPMTFWFLVHMLYSRATRDSCELRPLNYEIPTYCILLGQLFAMECEIQKWIQKIFLEYLHYQQLPSSSVVFFETFASSFSPGSPFSSTCVSYVVTMTLSMRECRKREYKCNDEEIGLTSKTPA